MNKFYYKHILLALINQSIYSANCARQQDFLPLERCRHLANEIEKDVKIRTFAVMSVINQ